MCVRWLLVHALCTLAYTVARTAMMFLAVHSLRLRRINGRVTATHRYGMTTGTGRPLADAIRAEPIDRYDRFKF
uniref:Putative secreted protein n=1 Tax=Anopheles darlingi TaxID=43151 RepID=A0A2M4DGL9_ANODA